MSAIIRNLDVIVRSMADVKDVTAQPGGQRLKSFTFFKHKVGQIIYHVVRTEIQQARHCFRSRHLSIREGDGILFHPA